jgi:hypothetical protein
MRLVPRVRTRWVRQGRGLAYTADEGRRELDFRSALRLLVGSRLIRWAAGAASSALLLTLLPLWLTHSGPFARGPSEHARANQAHDIVWTIAQFVGQGSGGTGNCLKSLFPAKDLKQPKCAAQLKSVQDNPTQRRLRQMWRDANAAYDQGKWKQARLRYEALMDVFRRQCTTADDLACQLISRYAATG